MFKFGRKGRGSEEGGRRGAFTRHPHPIDRREQYVFRRSRTLTGSAANEVKTSLIARTDLQSERLKLHELHQRRRVLLTFAFLSLIVAFGVWYLLASSIIGANVLAEAHQQLSQQDEQKIMRTVQQYINNYPTEAFSISLNTERFSAFMQRNYPEIKSVRLESKWLGLERSFHLSYRQALAAWQIGNKRFYIDAEGVAFTNLHGKPEPALKVEDASGFTPSDGVSVASKRFIRYLGQLLAALQAKNITTVERVVLPPASRELHLYFQGRPYPIKTHTDRDPYKQADDIVSALNFFDEKQLQPQYVDVRVEGRAYYK